ncbi:hypothetical protein [Mycolicibacterium aubagnense]|uniref:N,N-dimethylformamidase alpha subunit domain-containing protein n=1 Tax=Mycolicibacterium aubagnense TaxID=319707 RepID=A0ABN5YXI0_9MYCO|nr:hypothetical protein [Mycolicibacterium aubagnense]TLH56966.1 hypothetical protein C1S80_23275 [Mycolicibacterium aubagnense]WGI32881.1 hypothetical protein QDT91_00285 [Mycolicibacterium aubagnense]BBX85449.1 hypothetical protein MAUB_33220 [Mycolicibacterium aubagnense]
MSSATARTASDRTEELAHLHVRRTRNRIAALYTESVAEELDTNPFGPHTDRTARVLRYLRGLPITGKDILLARGADGPWAIGRIVIGAPGNMLVEGEPLDDYAAAVRTVLRRRQAQFVSNG